MIVIAIATRLAPSPGWLVQLVRAGAEAGIIGGLADWFAITVLFRHPFGIPLPHTAILPSNKDRIGRSLVRSSSAIFLFRKSRPVFQAKITGAQRPARAWHGTFPRIIGRYAETLAKPRRRHPGSPSWRYSSLAQVPAANAANRDAKLAWGKTFVLS
jgi:uncharacterized protein DUF445